VLYWKRRCERSVDRQRHLNMMTIETTGNAVLDKTRELCETILTDSGFASMRERIDKFMADDKARSQYDTVMAKGQALHEKQHRSLPLSGEEISDFEKSREALLANPVARGFLDAQEEMHELQETVQKHVAKTLELGRLPKSDDFEGGSCGSGCGCHH
jgi:cell fate (sporulation/competence/biofilm development) regulator YlbF (YheA/YmcA/DUF963 family)